MKNVLFGRVIFISSKSSPWNVYEHTINLVVVSISFRSICLEQCSHVVKWNILNRSWIKINRVNSECRLHGISLTKSSDQTKTTLYAFKGIVSLLVIC